MRAWWAWWQFQGDLDLAVTSQFGPVIGPCDHPPFQLETYDEAGHRRRLTLRSWTEEAAYYQEGDLWFETLLAPVEDQGEETEE